MDFLPAGPTKAANALESATTFFVISGVLIFVISGADKRRSLVVSQGVQRVLTRR